MPTAAERRAARRKLRSSVGEVDPEAKKKAPIPPVKDLLADRSKPEAGSSPDAPAPSSARSRDVVIVGCKVPNGLILQNHILIDGFEPVMGGGQRPVKVAEKVGDPIRIIGSARAVNADPDAKRVIAGFALTYNVPKVAFEKWMEDNKSLDVVKNRMIWAYGDEHSATDAAQDLRGVKTGLEAINTTGKKPDGTFIDPRMSKRIKRLNTSDDETTMSMKVG
jgi:hypothetical protein